MRNNIHNTGSFLQKVLTWAAGVLTFLFILSLFNNMGKVKKIEKEIRQKEKKIIKMEEKNEEIKKRLEEVKSDAYKEKRLRDDLGLAKEGDIIFILPDKEVLRNLAPSLPEDKESLPDPNWKRWLKIFDFNF